MVQKMDGKFFVAVFASECADLRCDYLKKTAHAWSHGRAPNLKYYQCDSGLLDEAVFGGLRRMRIFQSWMSKRGILRRLRRQMRRIWQCSWICLRGMR